MLTAMRLLNDHTKVDRAYCQKPTYTRKIRQTVLMEVLKVGLTEVNQAIPGCALHGSPGPPQSLRKMAYFFKIEW